MIVSRGHSAPLMIVRGIDPSEGRFPLTIMGSAALVPG
jgi:hypothetical protein